MRRKVKQIGVLVFFLLPFLATAKSPKIQHPSDVYDHEMHNAFFEGAEVACETCHADPESYSDRSKVNPMGCHLCHNSPKPILPAPNECALCHPSGPPKPKNHRADWLSKHQIYAKQNPADCQQCHNNAMFCVDCHRRRDTVQQKMHRRNFRLFHSIEARANPRKCDACHSVNYCQTCHSARGNSKR